MDLRPDHQFKPFSSDAAAYDDMSLPDLVSMLVKDMPTPGSASPDEVHCEAEGSSARIFGSHSDMRAILD